jgi:hypothetical protein
VRAVKGWRAGLDQQAIRTKIRKLLLDFHEAEIRLYPPPADKRLEFIICVKEKQSSNIFLWQTDGPGVQSIQEWALMGWDAPLYKYELGRLYRPDLRIDKAVAIGIFLFSLAKATNNYIGGDTQIIIVDKNVMELRDRDEVRQREEHVKAFNDVVAQIVLGCIDKEINLDDFKTLMQAFEQRALEFRDQYIPSIGKYRV